MRRIREAIIGELRNGPSTIDELMQALEVERKRLSDNLKEAIKIGLIERIRDDVTGRPAYRLTKAGQEWTPRQRRSAISQSTTDNNVRQNAVTRYSFVLDDGHATPEAAMQAALLTLGDRQAQDLRIIEYRVIGRVELRPVLIPSD